MSYEQKLFIKKNKHEKRLILITQISIIIIFLITWQLLASFNLINTFITSSPYKILNTIINLYKEKNLFSHIITTLYETITSFSLSFIIGLSLASLMWFNTFFAKVIEPYLTLINSIPKVALGPIIIIWIGANTNSIIFMSLLISLIITILNINNSFSNIEKNKIKFFKSLKASKLTIYLKLILPASKKNIFNALKINISMSLIGVIMGELLVSRKGIGYLIVYGSEVFNLDLVLTGIIIISLLAILLFYIIKLIEKKVLKNYTT